ncbi:D-alanyl-D-alanine carboxypeptidase / D-alanyl-D-alanine-endopeptidase (penicillin-binding protein 4) [Streptomyces sp. yr375]|uniref:D-alanyl-D-alanine carboxypeptidase/D-alanyl-D-alanine endopeptidase n=1 Tax=Streptomyces sp. yr375 TaxID=1761906 RepID=UPI0008B5F71E|nr:D-alanyl-D-alanine carboxypeptidase/D-alanyl-D-alanine-endopeptidase [Streptomyces sp. yr375]SES18599.1 D-alanyl-D-alanine carboxypeptidase / D-alanyl-D-alanine-endopeptidase (penicillin-binding protein 4) [Streptomyces sp. yr375]
MVRAANAVRPRLARAAGIVRPRLARVSAAAGPQVARLTQAAKPHLARVTKPMAGRSARPWQYTAGAATAGLALAAGVVTAAGPWDSTGQRTAERDRATALERRGGADHGRADDSSPTSAADTSDTSDTAAGAPRPAPSAASVLAGLGGTVNAVKSAPAALPTGAGLTGVLKPLLGDPALGTARTAAVVDVATGKLLYGTGADEALTPASTTKIATAVAALSAMGAEHRLTTRAALEPDTKELVLVGGGDPTLTARADADGWASLRTLAASTAAALKKRGLTQVTLSYDTTLFAGAEVHPIGVNPNLAPVTALSADEGRTDGSTSGPTTRVSDPAADTTRVFAQFLKAAGITTTAPGPSKATTRAQSLATVSSPPLSALVERMLTNSDNDIAEALARHTAVATGVRADFDGAGRAVQAQLKKLGLPTAGVRFKDGSGLNREDRLTANLLTALLVKAGDPARPDLRPVLTGLPVAGFTGTLTSRYADGAAGVVRAKTGTLTGVNALAGTVVDQDGRLLAFALLAGGTTDPAAAQAALDRAATALAGCGCR